MRGKHRYRQLPVSSITETFTINLALYLPISEYFSNPYIVIYTVTYMVTYTVTGESDSTGARCSIETDRRIENKKCNVNNGYQQLAE